MGGMARDIGQRASGSLGRLEEFFEERIGKAMERLGVPTIVQMQALHDRIDALIRERETLHSQRRPSAD